MAQTDTILVKPELKTAYFKNARSEKATYLELPSYSGQGYSLEKDIKDGGVQFTEVKKLLDKQKLSRVVALCADTLEMGLMAVTYLAMEANNRRTDLPFDTDDIFIGDRERWNETSTRIPVVRDYDLFSYLHDEPLPFESGGYLIGQQAMKERSGPYWCTCRKESICLVMTENMVDEVCFEAVDMFDHNRHVYVIFLDSQTKAPSPMQLPFDTMDREHFHALRNNFILSYAADEAVVSIGDADKKRYYKNVLKQNFRQRKIKVKQGFSYERIVNLAGSIKNDEVCQMIDKIINYAIKDMDDKNPIVLANSDFAFIDHFAEKKSGGAKAESGKMLFERNLVGLDEIKQQVYDLVNVMKYNQMRSRMGIGESRFHNVHVMLGAPGTAKTTVAKYMGMMMSDEKLLPDNRLICINGAELKGMYVGHSAPKTKALFDKYDIIIIDEAYSIVESDGTTDSFGNEAIAQLIIELEKHSTDKLVIFAGYGGEDVSDQDNRMLAFLDANPGIKSRITSTFYFKSYTADDMTRIFERIAKNSNYRLEDGSTELVTEFFRTRVKDRDFGNGREARVLLETAVLFAARRIMTSGVADLPQKELEKELTLLLADDIRQAADHMKQGFGSRKTGQRRIGFSC